MNCEDFNKIVTEVADYKSMQVSTRDEGVSHAALCAGCARKLVNARALSSNLLLAAGAESESAPARVKENLLAAFTHQQQIKSPSEPVVDIASRRKFLWWTAAAAAVAAVIVLAIILPVWRQTLAPVQPQSEDVKAKAVDTPSATPAVERGGGSSGKIEVVENQTPLRPKTRRVKNSKPVEAVAQNNTKEFLPLTYLAPATAMDTGTVVRVQLSRSALVSLGLPVNIEGSNDSVKAEVLLGDDGVARAIRLVQ